MIVINLLIATGIGILLTWLIYLILDWAIHRSMTLWDCNSYGYGSFKNFMDQYNSMEWKRDSIWPKSHFNYELIKDEGHKGHIHASIVTFYGKGMILKFPFAFMKYRSWLKANKLKQPKKSKVDWNTDLR